MSYTALYRKYRPHDFNQIVGQNTIVKILQNSVINNKVGHAYLFSGPRGTGKTSMAKIFSLAINCNNNNNGIACGKCEICKQLANNDTDIIEIDAASNNGVEEIREIRNNAKLLPNIGKYKIYIIDEVHMLSTGAFNALLKTLEEPPEHVVFILATTELQKIPLTIISRCQRFEFKKIIDEELEARLKYIKKEEKRKINDQAIKLIVKLSDGGLRDAINYLDQLTSMSESEVTEEDVYSLTGDIKPEEIIKLFNCIIENNISTSLNIINNLYSEGKNFSILTEKIIILLRNIMINNKIEDYFDSTTKKMLNNYKQIENDLCKEMTKNLVDLSLELKKTNNQKLVFEINFINLINIYEKSKLEYMDDSEIQQKLLTIEKREIKEEVIAKDIKEKATINETKETLLAENKQKKETKPTESDNQLNEMIRIRTNNVFASADKKILKDVKEKISLANDYITNKTYAGVASLLLDSNLMVASDKYLLFSFNYESSLGIFYNNLVKIEKLLNKIFDKEYKGIALTNSEWEKVKAEYVKNIKQNKKYIEIKEENISREIGKEENLTKTEETAINLFGEENIIVK